MLLCLFVLPGVYGEEKTEDQNRALKTSTNIVADTKNMQLISAGSFQMGSMGGDMDEQPIRKIYVDVFFIDRYETSVIEYQTCVDVGKCNIADTSDTVPKENEPVAGISFDDASAYCEYRGKRLPTEAEWEKAATWKNNTKYKYPLADVTENCEDSSIFKVKTYFIDAEGCGNEPLKKVFSGSTEINGTLHMSGNVWEWVSDIYGQYDEEKIAGNIDDNPLRVIRGGACWHNQELPQRGAFRNFINSSVKAHVLGVRCAYTPPADPS